MYFWAEKYFSGTSLDQQQANTAGGGAGDKRRGSRSGGSGHIERKGSFRVDHHLQQQSSEHRKSLGQLADEIAPRRGSRTGGGSGALPTGGREKTAQTKDSSGAHRKSLSAVPPGVPFAASPGGDRPQHRTSTLGEMAAAAAVGNASASAILLNIARALAVRGLLMAHSLLCIWAATETQGDNSVWAFALLAVCLVGEGFYAVIVRAGDDPKWFSPVVLLYLFATVPPLWLVYASMCPVEVSSASSVAHPLNVSSSYSAVCVSSPASFGLQPNPREGTVGKQLLGHSLFLTLLFTRWLLPRAELSREELTQILLAYAAVVTDILEFLGLLNACAVCADSTLHTAVLGAWTLSLAQFALVLTASRARKIRIALATKIIVTTNFRTDFRQAFYDVDIWAVLISLALQDFPFLAVRLFVFCWLWAVDFGQLLFAGKNLLIIMLQCYRISVLLNDRYLNPTLDARARSLIEERRQSMAYAKYGKMSMMEIGGSAGMLNTNSDGGTAGKIGGGNQQTTKQQPR